MTYAPPPPPGSHPPGSQPPGPAAPKVPLRLTSPICIYADHFGLTQRPFAIQPDPGFLYWSAGHKRAFSMLEYGLMTRAPITVITGEVGAGKTTLLHHLLKSLSREMRIGLVSNAHGDRGELLRWVLMALDQPAHPQETYVDLFDRFQRFLIEEYAAGRRVALIFDEAQNLSRESLEELRMFTNINANQDELLQLVLVGQPELRDIIRSHDLRQFAQRVSAAFHLGALSAEDVDVYIQHRMYVAGAQSPDIFTPEATQMIHRLTRGIPRLVNQLCEFALVYAFADDRPQITPDVLQTVLDDGVFFAGETFETEPAPNVIPVRPGYGQKGGAHS